MSPAAAPAAPVTRADIEAKLRQIRGEVTEAGETARGVAIAVGVAVAVVVVGVSFWLGRRRGRKQTTVVEIRQV